jgi:hypothetical protein
VIGVVPKNGETATSNGLSRKRLCCFVQAVICLGSESKDKQLAKSSANESSVRSCAANFS